MSGAMSVEAPVELPRRRLGTYSFSVLTVVVPRIRRSTDVMVGLSSSNPPCVLESDRPSAGLDAGDQTSLASLRDSTAFRYDVRPTTSSAKVSMRIRGLSDAVGSVGRSKARDTR